MSVQTDGLDSTIQSAEATESHRLESLRHAIEQAVLIDDLGDDADRLVASFGTRYALRLAMLQFPFRTGGAAELPPFRMDTDSIRGLPPVPFDTETS